MAVIVPDFVNDDDGDDDDDNDGDGDGDGDGYSDDAVVVMLFRRQRGGGR